MKPIEQSYTAWVDGVLTEAERTEFEAGLGARRENALKEALEDREAARQVGALLRRHLPKASNPGLANADFFNHQILGQIEARPPVKERPPLPMPLWRFLWAGGASLGVAAILLATLILPQVHPSRPQVDYFAQILNAQPGDPTISAVSFHSQPGNVTVLWLDGLDYIPTAPHP